MFHCYIAKPAYKKDDPFEKTDYQFYPKLLNFVCTIKFMSIQITISMIFLKIKSARSIYD